MENTIQRNFNLINQTHWFMYVLPSDAQTSEKSSEHECDVTDLQKISNTSSCPWVRFELWLLPSQGPLWARWR